MGGFTKEKIALSPRDHRWATTWKRKFASSANTRRCRRRCPFRRASIGHDPRYRSINQYDPVLANKLLDYFGYKKGADGYRTLPDGKPPRRAPGDAEHGDSIANSNELWKKSMDAIGIRIDFDIGKFADQPEGRRRRAS